MANYAYNGRGEQVRRVGKTNVYTLYDESGHWLGDYDNNGAVVQQAIWLDDLPVGVLAKTTLRYVQPDHLGTPRAVIDPTRDVAIWRWDLKGEAFGTTAPDQDPDKDGTAFVFDMRFPGQRYDALSGLNQNYFRDYEPGTGRYVQSDPLGVYGDISLYGYVAGDPISFSDSKGLVKWSGYMHGLGLGHVAIAAAHYYVHVQSECINGRRAIVDLNSDFVGLGLGVPVTYTISNVSIDDGSKVIDPNNLVGSSSLMGAGIAVGGGAAYSCFNLGNGKSSCSLGGQGGWDASVYGYPFGYSSFANPVRWVECGCN
ncbi:RHS repeat-associated core domain-containing protein [Xanthomonas sp. PPL139]|uniref:RHS repeat-associated core domain-containing protein n=1 Tax=unclassified Xanthomonas TaxID=2643310 RepID=UPI0033AD3D72